jgi:hypothetical protein
LIIHIYCTLAINADEKPALAAVFAIPTLANTSQGKGQNPGVATTP